MEKKQIEIQLKKYKIRQGKVFRRSGFLKQWSERWMVLCMHFLFFFKNNSCTQLSDLIQINDLKSIKSYLKKGQQFIPKQLKFRSSNGHYYICFPEITEKWSWITTVQRLLDYKYSGHTQYNNFQTVKSKGFPSMLECESHNIPIQKVLPQQKKLVNDVQKDHIQKQRKKLYEQLQQTQKQVDKKMHQLKQKQIQLAKKQIQLVKREQQIKQKQQQLKQLSAKNNQISTSNNSSKANQNQPIYILKSQQKDERTTSKVSELKNMFQQKTQDNRTSTYMNKKPSKKEEQIPIHIKRSKIVMGLFDQLKSNNKEDNGYEFIVEFLSKICPQKQLGYNQYVVYESKTHENRKIFAQYFMKYFIKVKNYEVSGLLGQFIEICLFQSPGLFSEAQLKQIKKKLLEFFLNTSDEANLEIILKDMLIFNKTSKYEKNEEIMKKLEQLVKSCKRQETRNWAKKLKDEI